MQEVGKDCFYIELVEPYPCSSKGELRARECEWIRKIGTLNMKIAGRSGKQWYDENKTGLSEM